MHALRLSPLFLAAFATVLVTQACGSKDDDSLFPSKDAGLDSGPPATDATLIIDAQVGDGGAGIGGDPPTCSDATRFHSYVGCDYWPTVTVNAVWSIFDWAVVVANNQATPASVTVTGPGGVSKTATIPANGLEKIYLPWVPALKGPDGNECADAPLVANSVVARKSAYHLVSSIPVVVYQFNALEYQGAGGPPGKDWSSCPGNKPCNGKSPIGCFSYGNDASLLLPSTAMTGAYRLTGSEGWDDGTGGVAGPVATITATEAATTLRVKLAAKATVKAGNGVTAGNPGDELTLKLDAGDVVELVGGTGPNVDLAGSLILADKPVQVLAGIPCINVPSASPACDNLEESVFPAETLGRHYFFAPVTGPRANKPGTRLRLIGNKDGTTLTYKPSKPTGCPTTLNAGQAVTCTGLLTAPFEVTGDAEFAAVTLLPGATISDPGTTGARSLGDPSLSNLVAVEQFRSKYTFLAPDDYPVSYADILAPLGTKLTVDGAAVTATFETIASGYGIARLPLGPGKNGAHTLEADASVGLQVVGYGAFTSYQYPGGLDLKQISAAPDK